MPTLPPLAARNADIAPFQVMEIQTAARRVEASGRSVVHMEIGEPDFPTPEPVLEAARRGIAQGDLYYTSALGTPELRAAIARWYGEHYGVDVPPERVIVTAGSSAALLLTLALLIDRDQQVVMADPSYPCNRHFVRLLEGQTSAVPVGPESSYQLTAELIRQHWTPRTRAALIASPSNPTGTQVGRAEMARIVDQVHALGGSLIVDEIYLGLSYGSARPESVLSLSDDIFVINSFSKYFNMTGWRLGWLVAPERHVRDLEKLAQNLYISPAAPSQRAALACFEPATVALLESHRRAFQERRDYLVPALRDLGFGIPVLPTGGFFVYADCSRFTEDTHDFCLRVLEEVGVAFTPGLDFGSHRANLHARFAYTIEMEKLAEGVRRLKGMLQ
jgi:aspartate/methionine/tyrosine aminotransferase